MTKRIEGEPGELDAGGRSDEGRRDAGIKVKLHHPLAGGLEIGRVHHPVLHWIGVGDKIMPFRRGITEWRIRNLRAVGSIEAVDVAVVTSTVEYQPIATETQRRKGRRRTGTDGGEKGWVWGG